jgi:hypothetical protein
MVTPLNAAGLAVMVLINSALAALATRFLRVRMRTNWGGMVYALLLVPLGLILLIPVYSGLLGSVVEFDATTTLLVVAVGIPLTLGLTFDYIWMPSPEDVETAPEAR